PMPVRIIEVDNIHGRDAAAIQSQMIVLHRYAVPRQESGAFERGSNAPDLINQSPRPHSRMRLDGKLGVLAAHHVKEHGPEIAIRRPMLAVDLGEILEI